MKLYVIILLNILVQTAIGQNLSELKAYSLEEAKKLETQTHEICQKLWEYSETALRETKSAELLINILEDEGFTIEKNVAGMPTAFVAKYGSGSPKIGILAEYDALPGVGNSATPFRQKREDGITSGQGCGHNLFGAASVNAAIAIKRTLKNKNVSGTLYVYGTPAEETVIGKTYMAKEGIFDDLDAVLEWHPGRETESGYGKTLAMNNFEVEFYGQAAHGAADPWSGRSALDAVELMNFGTNLMREHIHPTTRIHYVIPNGGDVPNVVPEYAKVWYFVRDTSRADVDFYYDRLLKIADGAATATFTSYKVTLLTGVHEYNLNEPLIMAIQENLLFVGPPIFTEEEQAWGRELQKSTDKAMIGFDTVITKVPSNWKSLNPSGGSTDVAEVSYIAPTAGFTVTTAPKGVPWHSWATTASHGTLAGKKGADVATKVLTLTGIDLFTNENLLKEAKEYFLIQTGGKPYQSPIPADQEVILPE